LGIFEAVLHEDKVEPKGDIQSHQKEQPHVFGHIPLIIKVGNIEKLYCEFEGQRPFSLDLQKESQLVCFSFHVQF
jgi:hypothetical protein